MLTPKKTRRARRLISCKWYPRLRAWKMHKMFSHFDHAIYNARPEALDHISEMLTRYALREAWYKSKK